MVPPKETFTHHLDSIFVEETLKDYIHDTFKELKLGTNNE
jgi:hypothetical protein